MERINTYNRVGLRSKCSAQVIVVGASISGLQAAYDLQQEGVSCVVLEARGKTGSNFQNRARATKYSKAWVSPDQHPQTWKLVHHLGLEMTEETRGKSIMCGFGVYDHDDIPFINEADRCSYTFILESMEILTQRLNRTKLAQIMSEWPGGVLMTFQDFITAHAPTPAVQKLADAWTTKLFGLAATDVPALDFLLACRRVGGFLNAIGELDGRTTHTRVRTLQSLKEAMAQRLRHGSILASQRVVHIDQKSDSKCVLTTGTGDTFECLKVILSAPLSSYTHLDFNPAIEYSKLWMQESKPSGFCIQTALIYNEPWWRTKGLSGYSQSTKGPILETYDTSNDESGVYALTCVVAGESGRELWNKDLIDRRETILAHLRDMFSMYTAIPSPVLRIEPKDTVWTRLASSTPGLGKFKGDDGWQVKGKVHFAVPEADCMRKPQLEMALKSGSRVAGEVSAAMMPTGDMILSKL
ncbi:hypothetical protein FPOAC2_00894 [Fusarium poae]|uniref:hypothetical protein n=1 Tax=Fusarium poae TaxID=36050 RepID=UPI001CE81DC3|nr:hypothetical protein FPOAC1_000829 [Fusarium poae]KAG8674857.1 hypothetical protein FPOAC1_000829 [Fusarium poae]